VNGGRKNHMRKILARIAPFFLLTVLGLVAYVNSLPNSFHYDDFPTIVQNGAIRDLKRVPSYFVDTSTWTISQLRDWRPAVLTTFALNYSMGGTNPILFRATNLFFHIGTAFFLYLILQNILNRPFIGISGSSFQSSTALAISAALLFLVHTANSEVVNYIFARSTLLASFFLIMGFYCYLRGPHSEASAHSVAWEVAGLGLYALGLASKATAITLPLLLVVFELTFLNPNGSHPWRLFRGEPERLRKYIPLLLLAFTYVAIRQVVAPRALARMVASHGRVYVYFLTQLRAWVYYLELLFWPDSMVSDYSGFGWSETFWDYRVLVSFGVVTAILGTAWALWKRQPVISFFIFWYFIALLPEASIVPLSDAVNAYRFYPANVGSVIAVVLVAANLISWLWRTMFSRAKAKLGAFFRMASLTVVLGALVISTWQRNEVFRDDGTYWNDVLKKDPTNVRALLGLGSFLLDEQGYAEAQRFFDRAIQLNPKNPLAYMFRGYLSVLLRQNAEALEFYNTAVILDPQEAYAYVLRGEAYRSLKDYPKAIADFDQALDLRPHYTEAYIAKATALREIGEDGKAYQVCRKGITIDRDQASFYLCLGQILAKQNQAKEAIQILQTATQRGLSSHELWYQLGLLYEQEAMYAKATEAFNKASRLMGQSFHQARPNLYASPDERDRKE
jgi:Tfp pilus assembly protein PilF